MRDQVSLNQVAVVAACSLAGCSNRVVYVDPPLTDASSETRDTAAIDSAEVGHPRTCDDVGKGVGIETCCDGGFCAGECNEFGYCLCPGTSIACPETTVCCPGLGCTSATACVVDGGDG